MTFISDLSPEGRKAYWDSVKSGEVLTGCRTPHHHGREFGADCAKCSAEYIDAMTAKPDKGPWQVNVWADSKVVLQSDDFTYDAALVVTGDFWDIEVKKAYAQFLADKLNGKM